MSNSLSALAPKSASTNTMYPSTPFFANIDGDLCRVENIRTEMDTIDVYHSGKKLSMPGNLRIITRCQILKTGESRVIDINNIDIISDDIIEKDFPEYVI